MAPLLLRLSLSHRHDDPSHGLFLRDGLYAGQDLQGRRAHRHEHLHVCHACVAHRALLCGLTVVWEQRIFIHQVSEVDRRGERGDGALLFLGPEPAFILTLPCSLVRSVSFIQMLKSLMPVAVYLVSVVFRTERPQGKFFLNMLLISFGVGVSAYGEIAFVLLVRMRLVCQWQRGLVLSMLGAWDAKKRERERERERENSAIGSCFSKG